MKNALVATTSTVISGCAIRNAAKQGARKSSSVSVVVTRTMPDGRRSVTRDASLELAQVAQDPFCGSERRLAGRRRRIAVARPLEQAHPQPLLEGAKPAKGGRVIDPEPARRAGQRAGLADGANEPEILPSDSGLA